MSGGEDRPDTGLQLHRVSALQYAAPRLSSLLSAQRVVSEMYSVERFDCLRIQLYWSVVNIII